MNQNEQQKIRALSDTQYVRPNQNWICGKADVGCHCPLGPSRRGVCRATFECQPAKQGDSWICTRTQSLGKCDGGPLPDGTCCRPISNCVPKRSLKSRRFQISMGVFALAIGMAAVLLSFPSQSKFISAGPLSHQHATTPNGCVDCHSVNSDGLATWVTNAMHQTESKEQSRKCLECHDKIGVNALNAHSISKESIADLKQIASTRSTTNTNWMARSSKALFGSPHHHGELQCATCHKEHQGLGNNLKVLSNNQCQVCHEDTFDSFSSGHHDFNSYPFRRRQRIYFDHSSHYNKHFTTHSKGDPELVSCTQCHVSDGNGEKIVLRSYEQSCASCHDTQIKDDLSPGFVVAGIPAIDTDTLLAKGMDTGLWPDTIHLHAGASGYLPPLMRFLLSRTDRPFRESQNRVSTINLSNLANRSDDDISKVHDFAWSLKEKLIAWAAEKPDSPPPSLNSKNTSFQVKPIPSAQLIRLQQRWFPNAKSEIESRENSTAFEMNESTEPQDLAKVTQSQNSYERSIQSGWYLQDSDLTLRYRATGHADSFFKNIIDSVVQLENESRVGGNQHQVAQPLLDELFDSISSPFASGRCTKCHTIDRGPTKTVVNWRGAHADQETKKFTRFSHSPHLTNMRNSECSACHTLDKRTAGSEEIYRSDFISANGQLALNPANFRCDFSNIGKQNCSKCHTNQAAGDRCLDCHNYHVR